MNKKYRWLVLVFPMVAIILEALPYGAVLNFSNGSGKIFRNTFSYFSLIPYGYANVAPLITAVLSCVLLILSVIFVLKQSEKLRKAINIVAIIAFVISLTPLIGGIKRFSIVGAFISLALLLHAVFMFLIRKK